jgi:S1-C subfamily serine protease
MAKPRPVPVALVVKNGSKSFSLPDVIARVLPSVVSISATRVSREVPSMLPLDDPFFHQFFGPESMRPPEYKEHGLGSGVVVQPNVILTNNHVIEGADEIKVTASDKQVFSAKVVGADSKSDLAVLRLVYLANSSQLSGVTRRLCGSEISCWPSAIRLESVKQ